MSSLLRYAVTPATASPVETIQRPTAQTPPAKKQKMSLTQTYYLAHTARGKLSKEAARGDHNLRLLVGHANLLDSLMLDLANAEQEQESWFNQTVKSAAKASSEDKQSQRVTWADQHTITEEEMYDEDSDSDSDDEELEVAVAARKITAQPMQISLSEDEDEEMEDDEYDAALSLTRSPSRGRSQSLSPPELMHEDSDSDESEDDSMPPSPPQTELLISEKARQAIATTSFYQSPSKPIDDYSQESQQIAIAAY